MRDMQGKLPEKMHRLKIGKGDWMLLAAWIAAGILLFILLLPGRNGGGGYVEVRVNGTVTQVIPLSQEGEYEAGGNRFTIGNGSVSMTDADCPDRLCVSMRPVSEEGESIVCLPNRVTLRITGRPGTDPEIDTVAE